MADVKISQLPIATTPLDGTEVLPIVQSATTTQVSIANVTAGRAVSASSLTLTTPLAATSGGTGLSSLGTGVATFLGTPSSANLASAVTDETGTGALVFGTSPTFTTSAIFPAGTASAPGITTTGDTNTGTFYPAADTIAWTTGGSERARIDSSGNIFVGSTAAYYLNNKFAVTQSSSTNSGNAAAFATTYAGDVGNAAVYVGKYDNNTTTSQVFVKFILNNITNGSGQINANGASAVAFGTWSDSRLKENISDLPPQLDNILALRPCEFDYIESEGGGHQIGFIAQDMQQVYPDAVGERADGMLTITAWSKTEARLVKAIQELSAKLDAAEARIAALEAN